MAEIVRMPEVLTGAASGTIQSWLVAPGTRVEVGATLAEIETEKAVVDFQANEAGFVGRILLADGATAAVGEPILVLVAEGEGDAEIDAALAAAGVAAQAPSSATEQPTTSRDQVSAVPATTSASETHDTSAEAPGGRLFASPIVRRLAKQHGVDVAALRGSGPNGRIVRRDLESHLATASTDAPVGSEASSAAQGRVESVAALESSVFVDVPLDRMRAAIARRLTESKSTVPHFYLTADCRVDELVELRARLNEHAPRRISLNDFVLKAAAMALMEVPEANAIWNDGSIRRFSGADIAVAVALDDGLTTPVIRGVDRLTLVELGAAVEEVSGRARAGRLKQQELEGGSLAVSNLGMYGTQEFSAILNPPQSGILAVGAARRAPVVTEEGGLTVGTVMTVTLSADHRVLDGAVAARWLAAFRRFAEQPLRLLL